MDNPPEANEPPDRLLKPAIILPKQAFSFMKLSLDLRLMVYERLPRETHYISIEEAPPHGTDTIPESLDLVRHTTSTTILSTCRAINIEATPYVRNAIENWVIAGGVKVISSRGSPSLGNTYSLLGILHKFVDLQWLNDRLGDSGKLHLRRDDVLNYIEWSAVRKLPEQSVLAPPAQVYKIAGWIVASQNILKRLSERQSIPSIELVLRAAEGENIVEMTEEQNVMRVPWMQYNVQHLRNQGIELRAIGCIDAGRTMVPHNHNPPAKYEGDAGSRMEPVMLRAEWENWWTT